MAEEKKDSGSVWEPIWWILGLLAALFVLWLVNGGPERGTIRELFISPYETPTPSIPENSPE